jgi:hypothetical protein
VTFYSDIARAVFRDVPPAVRRDLGLVEQQEELSRLLLTLRLALGTDEKRRAIAAGVQAHPTVDFEAVRAAWASAAIALDQLEHSLWGFGLSNVHTQHRSQYPPASMPNAPV